MSKEKQEPKLYDRYFEVGGFEGVFDLHYSYSRYYPLFRAVIRELIGGESRRVLEVGCGTGAFAHMLLDKTKIGYRGFDFSSVAIQKAKERTGRRELFEVGNALDPASYSDYYDTIVCTEVLEHIDKDLAVIEQWKPGVSCVCSVPNFDSISHVRYFDDETDIRRRYEKLIEIENIHRIKKPILSDISARNVFRQLRWSRYKPIRMAKILGFYNFDKDGGWFLFCGRRR